MTKWQNLTMWIGIVLIAAYLFTNPQFKQAIF